MQFSAETDGGKSIRINEVSINAVKSFFAVQALRDRQRCQVHEHSVRGHADFREKRIARMVDAHAIDYFFSRDLAKLLPARDGQP